MTKKQELYQLWEKDKKLNIIKAARKIDLAKRAAFKYVAEFKSGAWKPHQNSREIFKDEAEVYGPLKKRGYDSKRPIHTISVSTLIDDERLDIKRIIRQGIDSIATGTVSYDDRFRRDLGVPETRWKEYSRAPCFVKYRATLPNRKIVWGNVNTINKIKEMDGVS